MYWVGVVTAGLTAFYVFRAFFLCFFGSYRGDAHPHESPWIITAPLAVLALLSLGGGYIDVPRFLAPVFGEPLAAPDESLVYISVGAGLAGIFLAWLFYVVKPGLADSVAAALGGLYRLVLNKYFVDEAYDALIVNPIVDGSRIVLWRGVDAGLIDGAVDGAGSASRSIGGVVRHMQSGFIRRYAAWVVVGSILVILAVRFAGGAR
jgi:NADH-quinone oxidoreductase subunit L